jgi:hypothetical protein
MRQESSTDDRLYQLAHCAADLLGRPDSPEASPDLVPDDWNRGAVDHPYHTRPTH